MLCTKIILLGVDGVGKTKLLYKLKLNKDITTIPTIGFNVERIEYKDRNIIIWDIGGGYKIRYLWNHYFKETNCIIFMMDISQKSRKEEYIECFKVLIDQHKEYRNIPIIIFGNKFDGKKEFEPEEILEKISLPPEISPHVLIGNVKTGEGLSELLDYIYNNMEFKEEEIKEIEKEEEKEEDKEEDKEEENKIGIKKKDTYNVKMFGLSCAGKTFILYFLKLGEEITTIYTIGYNVETIENEEWEKDITIWDIGGKEQIRPIWIQFFSNTDGLIWVYDSSNEMEIEESKSELIKILSDSQIPKNMPLLIYANKTDLTNKQNVSNFLDGLEDYINNRPYLIKECNKNDLESYKSGLEWLYKNLK